MAVAPCSSLLHFGSFQSFFSNSQGSSLQFFSLEAKNGYLNGVIKCCQSKDSSSSSSSSSEIRSAGKSSKLEIGSPIIVTEAPAMIKTAASIPCLRVNEGLVKPGDVGRIVSRKPKDLWAVRLAIGTYLIDGKYFKPLEIEE